MCVPYLTYCKPDECVNMKLKIHTKDLNKNIKGVHVSLRLRIFFGWFAVLIVLLFFLLYNGLFHKKNWGHTSFFGKPPEISRYVSLP